MSVRTVSNYTKNQMKLTIFSFLLSCSTVLNIFFHLTEKKKKTVNEMIYSRNSLFG